MQGHIQTVMSLNIELLSVAIVLAAASIATMAMVSNPAFAGTGFKNKAECMEYKVVRNHVIQSAKVSKNLAEKLCAEY